MKVIAPHQGTAFNIPIKYWAERKNDFEEGVWEQAFNLAGLPFAYKHIALMPDAHQGYGMPIGGVLATERAIIPNAVGVDIGCGMRAVRTNLLRIDSDALKRIMRGIRKRIPTGFNHHDEKQDEGYMPDTCPCELSQVVYAQYESARKQIGTLGGGNHFIEIQQEETDDKYIWIMIHSGSRNLGYKVAKFYNDLAQGLNELYFSRVPKKHQLAFLPVGSEDMENYIEEMQYCVAFAEANRALMMRRIKEIIVDAFGSDGDFVLFSNEIDVPHNYVVRENHFNKNVWVHRKGAIRARKGDAGIIPGSQGTSSYIVEGLGNPESFCSCSHGAGRVMSRTQARESLNLEEEKKLLSDKGIIHSIRNKKDLDEASSAYKDIDTVMENQKDLVKIKVKLNPLAVIKGE